MKEFYEIPVMEIVSFEAEDVITTSSGESFGDNDVDWGGTGWG